jgi:hypothetical protein
VSFKLNPFTGNLDLVTPPPMDLLIPNVACDTTVFEGAAVYLDSLGVAYNAIATSSATANVIGIVESKQTTNICTVRVLGVSAAIYTGLDVTKDYYLSDITEGLITTVPISQVAGRVVLRLGQPYSSTKFLMMKGSPILKG